jgi:hypothetical protein
MNPKKIKTYTCRICKSKYERMMGQTYIKWCSDKCQDAFIKKTVEKVREEKKRKERKAWREKKRQYREELGITIDHLQKAINKIVRKLDENEPCIVFPALPIDLSTKQAGHSFSRSRKPHLKYLLLNIHGESERSNGDQNITDEVRVRAVADRYGDEVLEWLYWADTHNRPLKLTQQDKNEAIKEARKIYRELEQGAEYTRSYIDARLRIYKLPADYLKQNKI